MPVASTNIHPAIEQMRRKAVPQRVQVHRLLDPGRICCLVEQPVELPRLRSGRRCSAYSGMKGLWHWREILKNRIAYRIACSVVAQSH
jgi:hypothetical protein